MIILTFNQSSWSCAYWSSLREDIFIFFTNEFNFLSKSNQDEIDLNKTGWVRNTEPYELLQDDSSYDYVSQSYNYVTQEGTIVYASEGAVKKLELWLVDLCIKLMTKLSLKKK